MVAASGFVVGGGVAVALYSAYSLYWWYEGEKVEKPKYTVTKILKRSSQRFKLRAYNEIEVREYEPYLMAEVTIHGKPMRKALSEGFMSVAKYIFGDNMKQGSGDAQSSQANEKVPMTAPVRVEMPQGKAESEKIPMTAPVRTTVQNGGAGAPQEGPSSSDAFTAQEAGGAGESYKVSFVMPSSYTKDTLPVPKNGDIEIKQVDAHKVAVLTTWGGSPSRSKVQELGEKLKRALEAADLKTTGDVMLYQYHPPFAPSFLRRVEVLYKLDT